MLKDFILRLVANWKMKDVPEAQREQILALVKKDPDLFKKISEEVERRKKGGESEMKASMEVMRKYRGELQKLMQR
ncbi:MAG: hypothetical protein KGI41_01180 [Patescibacteria group bacterium]|nr:hypothetical protein [Patescibacteria group bacterium]MDE1965839.1 hypothetical protein [Patescibacteria group bacterium]